MEPTVIQNFRPPDSAPPRLRECEERLLLERVTAQDVTAFRALYFAYHKRMSRFLFRFVRQHDLVEEIINDTMYVVWCKAKTFRGDSQISTWIFGIAYRRALKTVRKDGHSPLVYTPMDLDSLGLPDDAGAGQRELRDSIDTALATLPTVQRIVIELAYFMGHSCEEIAAITDSPVNTVKTRMFHARERLRGLLKDARP
jgi:RNA polymerase sigma-70 factor (ECF subfamily)